MRMLLDSSSHSLFTASPRRPRTRRKTGGPRRLDSAHGGGRHVPAGGVLQTHGVSPPCPPHAKTAASIFPFPHASQSSFAVFNLQITDMDFHDSILTLGLSEDVSKTLLNVRCCIGESPVLKSWQHLLSNQGRDSRHFFSCLQLYMEHRTEIRRILDSMSLQLLTYKNLEWRIDVQVGAGTAICLVHSR